MCAELGGGIGKVRGVGPRAKISAPTRLVFATSPPECNAPAPVHAPPTPDLLMLREEA